MSVVTQIEAYGVNQASLSASQILALPGILTQAQFETDEIQEPLTIKLEQVYSNIENQIRMDKFQSVIDERIKNIKKDAKIIIK